MLGLGCSLGSLFFALLCKSSVDIGFKTRRVDEVDITPCFPCLLPMSVGLRVHWVEHTLQRRPKKERDRRSGPGFFCREHRRSFVMAQRRGLALFGSARFGSANSRADPTTPTVRSLGRSTLPVGPDRNCILPDLPRSARAAITDWRRRPPAWLGCEPLPCARFSQTS